MRPLVAKPIIEPTNIALLRLFPFRSVAVSEANIPEEENTHWSSTAYSAQQLKVLSAVSALDALFREPLSVGYLSCLARLPVFYCLMIGMGVYSLQAEEQDVIQQRLSTLGASSEKEVLDCLVRLSRMCVQTTESIKTEVRRDRATLFENVEPSGKCTAWASWLRFSV